MESNRNYLIDVFFSVFMCMCEEGCALYVARATITHPIYVYACSPFCLGIQFLRGKLLYPVWIYFSTLGGEGIFVRVGVKTEFIAWWLPSRMRTAMMMGRREDPPSQWGCLLLQERGRRSLCSCGCETRENGATED